MSNIKKEIGDYGENLAAQFLHKNGYTILERNFRVSSGELDIIALQRETLVVVEVKTRKDDSFYSAREAVTISKQNKIKAALKEYISGKKLKYNEIRFDVIEVYTKNGKIEHFADAF